MVRQEDCWAKTTPDEKPGISVLQHCRTAAVIARMLLDQRPAWLTDLLRGRHGVALAALHDVGKVAIGFQCKCPAWTQAWNIKPAQWAGAETDHAKIGQRAVQEELERGARPHLWAAAIGAHHGRIKGERIPALCDGEPNLQEERRRLIAEMMEEFGPLPDTAVDGRSAALWFNAGLIAVADWLASDECAFPPNRHLDPPEIVERARTHLKSVGFHPMDAAIKYPVFASLFPRLTGGPNSLQRAMLDVVRKPGIYIVEASMGTGKTEAALLAAAYLIADGRAAGLYFALPTQTTSHRMYERVADFIERFVPGGRVQLIHANSWLQKEVAPITGEQWADEGIDGRHHDGRDWFASSRRALLAPFGVGTVDQALLGVVAAKHFFVRQFGLAGKVVVLDEVHSYDLYTGTLIDELVRKLRELGATVVILSATLTAERRRQLLGTEGHTDDEGTPYPLISILADGEPTAVSLPPEAPKIVHTNFSPVAELTDIALDRASAGQCVLWIRNTVHEAQDTYGALKSGNRAGGPDIALIHARFPLFRREELENEWLDRLGRDRERRPAGGCVLVATQVAEQSVDIDADLLITDLAPTDMLLQRIGRLWRHPGKRPAGCDRPEVRIALPAADLDELRTATSRKIRDALGPGGRVYAPYVLLRTLDQWRTRTSIELPGNIRALLQRTYEARDGEPPAWNELRGAMERKRDCLRSKALFNANVWNPTLTDREGVQTRWGEYPTVNLLLVNTVQSWDSSHGANLELLDGTKIRPRNGAFDFACAKAIHRNLVKVPRWSVAQCLNSTPRWLQAYAQESTVALRLEGDRLTTIPDRSNSRLTYRADHGVRIPAWTPPDKGGTMPIEALDESDDW